MRIQKIVFLLFAFLILVGSSTQLRIEVAQKGPLISFKFGKVNNLFHGAHQAEINTLSVVQRGSAGWSHKCPVWQISLDPGSSLPVSEIKYGQVPNGFKEIRKASSLIKGQTYRVTATGPGSSGFVDFTAGKN